MVWTPRADKRLAELFADATLSRGQIAEMMECTTNAVIARAGKLGLKRPITRQRKTQDEEAAERLREHLTGHYETQLVAAQVAARPVSVKFPRRVTHLFDLEEATAVSARRPRDWSVTGFSVLKGA